ncbi:MAG: S1C family serine protease [Planctomycetota bacterium]|nr:S1C family serine protease [Planctomycetota bacterium]MEE3181591.1 S1C family serine protease [Planctomycetota bacterium]
MRLSASKLFAVLVVFGWSSGGPPQLPAAEGSPETKPADFSELYGKISRAVVGITRRDFPRTRSRSTITHFGTGTLLDPVGLVLTSPTVVPQGSRNIDVYLRGGRVAPAVLIKVYPEKEVSLLQLKDFRRALEPGRDRLDYLRPGSSKALALGDPVFSLGNAFGSIQSDDQVVMAAGVFSAMIELKDKHPESIYVGRALEFTAALNNGMDGGPLVDAKGNLVGLLILNFSRQRWLGTAIPIDDLQELIRPHRSWFDDRVEDNVAIAGLELMRSHEGGRITILKVKADGPAAEAGLRRGDVLKTFNGKKVESVSGFKALFKDALPGQQVRFEVVRDKGPVAVDVTLWGRF